MSRVVQHVLRWQVRGAEQKHSSQGTAAFPIKGLQEKLLSATVQPLEQELHSPCVYCKGWSDVWKVCAAFHFKHKEVLFLCGSWERKPQKFPLLSMRSAQNTVAGNTCSCLRNKSPGSSAVVPCSPKTCSAAKGVTLDNFASCPNRPIRSPKIEEIRRLNNVE